LSFLNAATENPVQNTIGPRSPNTPKNAVVRAGLITIPRSDNTTLLIIIVLIVLLLGGGWYGRGRWY
jgi:hypothetical protein